MSEISEYDKEDTSQNGPEQEEIIQNKDKNKDKNKGTKKEDLEKKISHLIDVKVDVEDLICAIKTYPALWDSRTEEYSNKHEKLNAWSKVIIRFFENFDEMPCQEKNVLVTNIQKRWRNIRICYARELRKLKEKKSGSGSKPHKKYIYFEQLQFLETLSKKTSNSLGVNEEDEFQDEETEDVGNEECNERKEEGNNEEASISNKKRKPRRKEEGNNEEASTSNKKRKYRRNEEEELIQVLKNIITFEDSKKSEEKDEDKLFFLSLLSEMQKVPPVNKLKLRSDIIAAIAKAQIVQAPNPHQWFPMQNQGPSFGF